MTVGRSKAQCVFGKGDCVVGCPSTRRARCRSVERCRHNRVGACGCQRKVPGALFDWPSELGELGVDVPTPRCTGHLVNGGGEERMLEPDLAVRGNDNNADVLRWGKTRDVDSADGRSGLGAGHDKGLTGLCGKRTDASLHKLAYGARHGDAVDALNDVVGLVGEFDGVQRISRTCLDQPGHGGCRKVSRPAFGPDTGQTLDNELARRGIVQRAQPQTREPVVRERAEQ
jgi:hypothetical protein